MGKICWPVLILSIWTAGSFLLLNSIARDNPQDTKQAPSKQEPLLSPDTELKTWISFVDSQIEVYKQTQGHAGFSEKDAPYLYVFSTYAVPNELRGDCEVALNLALNSTMYFKTEGAKPRQTYKVPGSKTLHFVDIRDFGWTFEQMDAAYDQQPFFLDPVVDHRLYNYARLRAGNVMFRADWFVYNVLDTTVQLDRDEKNLLYYILLYGKGNEPKDINDFLNFWQVDRKTLEVEQVETGAIIDQGRSGVSKHTRQLRRGNTIFGYYHETRDVKAYQKKRDFIEDPFATNFDASEQIASHKNVFQVYMLTNGNAQGQKRVDFADNGVVTDKSDTEDARVRTPKSCIVCHAVGINPGTDAFASLIKKGGQLNAYDKKIQLALEAFYLNNWGGKVKRDNEVYAEAVKAGCGVDPLKATAAYVRLYDWYRKGVTQEQAARECGMTLPEYLKQIKPNATGRLTQLFVNTEVPREVWDSIEAGGGYIQSQLLAKRIQAFANPQKKKVEKQEQAESEPKNNLPKRMVVIRQEVPLCDDKNKILVYLNKGSQLDILDYDGEREAYKVQAGTDLVGWVHENNLQKR